MWNDVQSECLKLLEMVSQESYFQGKPRVLVAELATQLATALKTVLDVGKLVGVEYTPELARALVDLGLPKATVAELFGVTRPTVHRLLKPS